MDPAKIEAIIKWEALKTVKAVQGFLGFANFYRKFIKNFSQLVMPLTNLMKKDTKFDWSETTNEAFSKLKQIFITAPLLIQFDNTRETVLETNVSVWCIGGTLSQYIDVLRPQSQTRKVCRERLPKFAFGNLGKRSARLERWQRSRTCQTFLTFHLIYMSLLRR